MNILSAITIGAILLAFMFGTVQHMKANKLQTQVENQQQAIKAYEQILIAVPFSAMIGERKANAKDEINATLSGDANIVPDGIYNGL